MNNTLQTLYFNSNQMKNDGLKHITEALKHNHSVTHINLCTNEITNQGADYILELLSKNRTLTKIDLTKNTISKEKLTQIEKELSYNQKSGPYFRKFKVILIFRRRNGTLPNMLPRRLWIYIFSYIWEIKGVH